MTQRTWDRRRLVEALGAGVAAAGGFCGARAATVDRRYNASRLPGAADSAYRPPTSMAAIADAYRRMTAPVRVNGHGPYRFVVDTGANQSVISAELAADLGLGAGPTEPLNDVAGVRVTATTLADLDLGRRHEPGVVLSVLPAAAIGAAGMLGLDRLEGQRLTLDFGGREIRIDHARNRAGLDGDAVVLAARRRDGQLTLVEAAIAGVPVIAFLDSGAQNTIGNAALRDLALISLPQRRWSRAPVVSVTGQILDAEMAELPDLRLGGLRLSHWLVAFADLHTFRMWNMVREPAILIGVDVLSRFQSVCLDFARDEVRLSLPPRLS